MEIKLTYEEQGFKGHVIIDTVSTSKRFRVMKEFGLTPKNISEDVFSDFGVIADLIDKSKEYYKKVDLKKGNKSYKSFDDLDDDPACGMIIQDCAIKALMGLGDDEKK